MTMKEWFAEADWQERQAIKLRGGQTPEELDDLIEWALDGTS